MNLRPVPANSLSVLIVRLDAIGDAAVLTPLLHALRARGMRTGIVLRAVNAGVFTPAAVDRVHIAEYPLRDDSPPVRAAIDAFGASLCEDAYDAALIATEDSSGYRLARAANVPRRIGFDNGWGKPFKTLWAKSLCTQTVHRAAGLDPRAPHECDILFSLGAPLLGNAARPTRDAADLRPLLIDAEPDRNARVLLQVTDKWQRLGARLEDVVLLARRAAAIAPLYCVAAHDERTYADEFTRISGTPVDVFDGLAPWKRALASARAVLAPDSGAVALAGMLGTPSVAAFPPENYVLQTARWTPWAAPYRTVCIEDGWSARASAALDELLR